MEQPNNGTNMNIKDGMENSIFKFIKQKTHFENIGATDL